MKAIEYLRKGFIFLLVWNLILSFIVVSYTMEKDTEKLNQQICNLEAIPAESNVPEFELIEE